MAFQTLRGTLTFSRQCHNAATGVGLGSSRTLRHFQQMFNALHLLNDVETGPCEIDWPNGAWTSPCLSRQLGNGLAPPQRTTQYLGTHLYTLEKRLVPRYKQEHLPEHTKGSTDAAKNTWKQQNCLKLDTIIGNF